MQTRIALAVAALLGTACLVEVHRVSDPRPAFRRAHEEALREEGGGGRARELNVLAWDPNDHELVRVSLPLWLCRKFESRVDWDDEGEERAARAVRRHVRMEELEKARPGILVEVEEEDGERVLIWLR